MRYPNKLNKNIKKAPIFQIIREKKKINNILKKNPSNENIDDLKSNSSYIFANNPLDDNENNNNEKKRSKFKLKSSIKKFNNLLLNNSFFSFFSLFKLLNKNKYKVVNTIKPTHAKTRHKYNVFKTNINFIMPNRIPAPTSLKTLCFNGTNVTKYLNNLINLFNNCNNYSINLKQKINYTVQYYKTLTLRNYIKQVFKPIKQHYH